MLQTTNACTVAVCSNGNVNERTSCVTQQHTSQQLACAIPYPVYSPVYYSKSIPVSILTPLYLYMLPCFCHARAAQKQFPHLISSHLIPSHTPPTFARLHRHNSKAVQKCRQEAYTQRSYPQPPPWQQAHRNKCLKPHQEAPQKHAQNDQHESASACRISPKNTAAIR